MSVLYKNVGALTEDDFERLIGAGTAEGTTLEFKRDIYGRSDDDKKEFLKDVSAMANSAGGTLLIGIGETDGIATSIQPMAISVDPEILRLEQLLQDGIAPRIFGVTIRAVPVRGGHVIAIRVPRSWNPPHRAEFKNSKRFYIRSSKNVTEATVEDLRVRFTLSSSAFDRVRAFRRERLDLIAKGHAPVPLAVIGGRLLVHVVPVSASEGYANVDIRIEENLRNLLAPVWSSGRFSSQFNLDGFMTVRGEIDHYGYTQLFRNGIIESVKSNIITKYKNTSIINGQNICNQCSHSITNYINMQEKLQIPPPFVVMITLLGIRNTRLMTSERRFLDESPSEIRNEPLALPEVIIENFGSDFDYRRAMIPAFDALWNAGGYPQCDLMDDEREPEPSETKPPAS